MMQALANHLWQSTLFAVAIGILSYLLRGDSAQVRYWLWWAASLKFLLPFSLLTALGASLAATTPGLVPEAWTNTIVVVAAPFAERSAWAPGVVLLGLWIGGVVFLLGRWLIGTLRLRAILKTSDRDATDIRIGNRTIAVYRTDERVEPGVVGIWQPVLLLPHGIEHRLNPAQLEAVLAHEVTHIERGDNLTAAVHMLVEAAFWFHPLVWWIGARLIDERERACDEMVVAAGHDRSTYAEGILDVCELYVATPIRCAAGISGSDLKRRVTQIMRYQGMNGLKLTKKFLLGAASSAALGVPLLLGFTAQNTSLAQDEPPAPPAAAAPAAPPAPPAPRTSTDEYLPIVKIAPVYPPRAAARGLEGVVVVEYTVNETGATENVVAVESTSTLFEQAAIESARRYKYVPRVEDGLPVRTDGVRTRIVFALEQ